MDGGSSCYLSIHREQLSKSQIFLFVGDFVVSIASFTEEFANCALRSCLCFDQASGMQHQTRYLNVRLIAVISGFITDVETYWGSVAETLTFKTFNQGV